MTAAAPAPLPERKPPAMEEKPERERRREQMIAFFEAMPLSEKLRWVKLVEMRIALK